MSMIDDDGFDPWGYVIAAIAGVALSIYGSYKGVTIGKAMHWALLMVGLWLLVWVAYRLIGRRSQRRVKRLGEGRRPYLPGDGDERKSDL